MPVDTDSLYISIALYIILRLFGVGWVTVDDDAWDDSMTDMSFLNENFVNAYNVLLKSSSTNGSDL